jgi:hypothetical protein
MLCGQKSHRRRIAQTSLLRVWVCSACDTFNPMQYEHSVRFQPLMMSCKHSVCQLIDTPVTVGTLLRFTTALGNPAEEKPSLVHT